MERSTEWGTDGKSRAMCAVEDKINKAKVRVPAFSHDKLYDDGWDYIGRVNSNLFDECLQLARSCNVELKAVDPNPKLIGQEFELSREADLYAYGNDPAIEKFVGKVKILVEGQSNVVPKFTGWRNISGQEVLEVPISIVMEIVLRLMRQKTYDQFQGLSFGDSSPEYGLLVFLYSNGITSFKLGLQDLECVNATLVYSHGYYTFLENTAIS